jgi:GntR family transcriptional regulator
MASNYQNELKSGQHRYAALAQSLLHDIESGRYPVGSLLPTEIELVEQFGLSRHTVREAIRQLQQVGLVTRRKGVGTRVKAGNVAARYTQSCASITDLFQYAKEVRLTLGEAIEVVADDKLAKTLGCNKGQRWLKYVGLRKARNHVDPVCYTEVYVRYEYVSISKKIQKSPGPIYALIEKEFSEKVHEVNQQISALAIPADIAKQLGARKGAPGLFVSRHYIAADDRLIEVALSIYPADRFTYSTRLRLDTSLE